MHNQQQPQGPQIDLKNTDPVLNEDGSPLFLQGMILRKVSKFVTGTPEDTLLTIPVFYDPKTFKILENSVPGDIREEFEEMYSKENQNED